MADSSGGGVLRQVVALFGVKWDQSAAKQVDSGINQLAHKLEGLGHWVAHAFGVHAIESFVESTIAGADQIVKDSKRIGISADELEVWQFAATRSGVSAEALQVSLARLQRSAFEAANGGKQAAEGFRFLGISVKNTNGQLKSPTKLFYETAQAISATSDPSRKAALAMRVFGRGGATLLPLLNEGQAGLEELRKRFEELGGGFSTEFLENSEKSQDAIEDFETSLTGLKGALLESLLPVLTRFFSTLGTMVGAFKKSAEGTNIFKAALITLGAIASVLALKLVAPFLPAIIAIGLITLAVDELITTWEGGDTLLRDFIDGMFGVGATAALVQGVKAAWDGLVSSITAAYRVMQPIFASINKFFQDHPFAKDLVSGGGLFAVGKATGLIGGNANKGAALGGFLGGSQTAQIPTRNGSNAVTEGSPTASVTNGTVINVHGVTDPKAVAREVDRKLSERDRRVASTLQEVEVG